jgi:integrase/recombinase XerD
MKFRSIQQNHASAVPRKEARLSEILRRCEGAYSPVTLKGYAADLRKFASWCRVSGREWLPGSDHTIAAFIDHEIETMSASTVRRRLSAIKFAHRISDLPNPTGTSIVHLALRRAARRKSRRPDQSRGLTSAILQRILDGVPETVSGIRDAAILAVGYDTLCRSCELSAMTVGHVQRTSGKSWSIIVPRSKGDPAGDGRIAWLSPRTVDRLALWLDASGITEGPLFRGLNLARVATGPLDTSSIRRLVKRAALVAGVETPIATKLSGHSMRVGAAQDMLVAGFDALAIMQAGGWKSTNVLLRYVENAETRSTHEKRWGALAGLHPSAYPQSPPSSGPGKSSLVLPPNQ